MLSYFDDALLDALRTNDLDTFREIADNAFFKPSLSDMMQSIGSATLVTMLANRSSTLLFHFLRRYQHELRGPTLKLLVECATHQGAHDVVACLLRASDLSKILTFKKFSNWISEKGGHIHNPIARHHQDRAPLLQHAYRIHSHKEIGVQAGFIVQRKTDDSFFVMKQYTHRNGAVKNDTACYFNEYIAAPLYRRVLYNRAPIVELVSSGTHHSAPPETGVLTSKYLHRFTILPKCKKDSLANSVGLEKVLVAQWLLGESDYNPGNIGLMKEQDSTGAWTTVFAKIDHGLSMTQQYTTPDACFQQLRAQKFLFDYLKKLPVQLDKIRECCEHVASISDDEIQTLIANRVAILKKSGIRLTKVRFNYSIDKQIHYRFFQSWDALQEFYINMIITNRDTLQNLAQWIAHSSHSLPQDLFWQATFDKCSIA